MEYTYGSPGCLADQNDLIDFDSDPSVDNTQHGTKENKMQNTTETPVLKSKERGRINGDIVAIKSGSGDIAFVAVGRPTSIDPKKTKKSHRKTRSSTEGRIYQSESFPNGTEKIFSGIDNLGYATVLRKEFYKYDETGLTYSTQPERFRSADHSPVQPEYVEVDDNEYSGIYYATVGASSNNDTDYHVSVRNTSQHAINVAQSTATSQHSNNEELQQFSSEVENADESRRSQSEDRSISPQSRTSLDQNERSANTTPVREETDTVTKSASAIPKSPPMCKLCGQTHGVTENHEYNYLEEVDEDLMCDICLQPLVDPYDTKCGHTFCCVCIKNYLRVKNICPIDREELTNSNTDCWQSSLILRKLLNKLKVTCPHETHCKKEIQRCSLKDHLKDSCPGAINRCPKSMYGCVYKAPRASMSSHLEECLYKEFTDKLSDLHPLSEDVVVELFRPEGTAELGVMIVGGSDTPLHYIMIQDILSQSIADQDGRLHIGDIIVSVNDEPMFSVTHAEARAALTKPSNLMQFSLLRDIETDGTNDTAMLITRTANYNEECVCLIKPPLEQLGIRISSSETAAKGVYIIELISGQVAESDGRLQVGDRIMKIGQNDLTDSTPEQAARVIGSCDKEVKILVRHSLVKPTIVCNEWAHDTTLPRPRHGSQSTTAPKTIGPQMPSMSALKYLQKKKIISVKKNLKENLGIIVSGGNGSPRGNLPIFVQDVLPMSVLGKDKRIKRGDLLSEINFIKLTGLSHTQAMNVLRESAQQREVTLVAYELDYEGKAEDTALWDELTSLHQNPSKWAPSWKMWLAATHEFSAIKEVNLRKSSSSINFGFKIIGGFAEDQKEPSPVFVTHISRNTNAGKYLKCGDEILAINKRMVKDISYQQVLNIMKLANYVSLKIVSWPGSLH